MLSLILSLLKGMSLFTGSYSINVFPDPLTEEEEEKCIDGLLRGDTECRNKLIEHNLRLVAHIVKKFDTKGSNTDDLISIGTIGLIKGIDSYRPDKNVKITTYASRCIQNEILMHFRTNKKTTKDVSLSDSIGFDKEGNEISLIDVLKDESDDIVENLHLQELLDKLNKYMSVLTPREKNILEKRYGLNNTEVETQKEIAKNLHISRSYVSRIEKRALTKILKEFLKNE
ncbi:MAG TPA: RNA polymerase sporulation sigma factor SigK [Firmicutes bacterium]|nr:RNA polymerase sporulation sigma factor SigK [Bacillota bacterium]